MEIRSWNRLELVVLTSTADSEVGRFIQQTEYGNYGPSGTLPPPD